MTAIPQLMVSRLSSLNVKPNREIDWVVDKGAIFNTNSSGGELALVLTEDNGGTRLSSTKYLHYGTVTATRTS